MALYHSFLIIMIILLLLFFSFVSSTTSKASSVPVFSVQTEHNRVPIFKPTPKPPVDYELSHDYKLDLAIDHVSKYINETNGLLATVLTCTQNCSSDIIAIGKWFQFATNPLLTSSLHYHICIAPNGKKRALDELVGLRIIHYHQFHKAYDMNYDLCIQPYGDMRCRKIFHSNNKADRCISGTIENLPIVYEQANQEQGTYMEVHLLKEIDKKINRINKREAHTKRTIYTITDLWYPFVGVIPT
jgi:hypothetical protein